MKMWLQNIEMSKYWDVWAGINNQKVTNIIESNDLLSMSLATIFSKLQEHELELSRLNESERTCSRSNHRHEKRIRWRHWKPRSNEVNMSLLVRKLNVHGKEKGTEGDLHSLLERTLTISTKSKGNSSTPNMLYEWGREARTHEIELS